jgi:hypothetical protein
MIGQNLSKEASAVTYETKIVPRGDSTAEIESNDPEVVVQLDAMASARLVDAQESRKRFALPAHDARIHFPDLFGQDEAA